MSAGNNIAVTLKVIVHDIDNATIRYAVATAPAYIVSGTTTAKPFFVSKFPRTPQRVVAEQLLDRLAGGCLTLIRARSPSGSAGCWRRT